MSQNQPSNLPTNTFDKWRKACKKKDLSIWNVPPPVVNIKWPTPESFTVIKPPDPKRLIAHDRDIWKITFPKIAEDLIDPEVFRTNVVNAVGAFVKIHFPLDVEIVKSVRFSVSHLAITSTEYGHYPEIVFRPTFSGPKDVVDEFLQPFHNVTNGHELYWKGTFLKNKGSGQITGIRLLNLAYNLPYKFSNGQPIAYNEYTVL